MLWPHYGWSMRQASALLLVPDSRSISGLWIAGDLWLGGGVGGGGAQATEFGHGAVHPKCHYSKTPLKGALAICRKKVKTGCPSKGYSYSIGQIANNSLQNAGELGVPSQKGAVFPLYFFWQLHVHSWFTFSGWQISLNFPPYQYFFNILFYNKCKNVFNEYSSIKKSQKRIKNKTLNFSSDSVLKNWLFPDWKMHPHFPRYSGRCWNHGTWDRACRKPKPNGCICTKLQLLSFM